MKKNVIVDVDAGSDDAVAILLLLTLECDFGYNVLGITCTHGNTKVDYVCINVLRTLETIKREDVPVFRGAESPLVPIEDPKVPKIFWHGTDGFGDINLSPPKTMIQSENAIAAMNKLVSENEDVSLICLGPLTNVALALKTYSEFSKNLKELYVMGGNVNGIGNVSSAAEFNFYKDPEAAHIVLSSVKCPITILPWEPCIDTGITTKWRFETLGKFPNPQVHLLNAVENKLYRNNVCWNPCDAFLAAAFLDENIISNSTYKHLSVELQGLYTRGQVAVDHKNRNQPNCRIIHALNFDLFKELIVKMASYRPLSSRTESHAAESDFNSTF